MCLVLYFSGVEKKKSPKSECTGVSRTFGMGTSGPHVAAQPGGKAADREKQRAVVMDKLLSLVY